MARKQRTPLAVDRDGTTIYVELRASGIHPLVAMADGLSLTFFGREKKAYIKVETALAWYEKELEDTGGWSGGREIADALREILSKFRAGEVVEA